MEVLIRAVDKVNPDCAVKNISCYKKFDIVAMMDDKHPWSAREKTNPAWRIVKMPKVSASELSVFIERGMTPQGHLVRARRCIDFGCPTLGPEFAAFMADDERKRPFFVLQIRGAGIKKLKRDKPEVKKYREVLTGLV